MRCPRPERPATPNEAAVVRWLLDHAPVGGVTAYLAKPTEELRVVGECNCGCASLFFTTGIHPGYRMIADAWMAYPDGHKANLILWGQEGEIIWLEVDDYSADGSHRVPSVANLQA